MFSKDEGAVITGRMTDNLKHSTPVQRFSDAANPWFYLHVKDNIRKKAGPVVKAIPLAEYRGASGLEHQLSTTSILHSTISPAGGWMIFCIPE